MHTVTKWAPRVSIVAALLSSLGCEEASKQPAPAESAHAKPAPTPVPTVASPAQAPPEAPAPPADCPKGSSGPGTYDKPCEASGADRLMEVTWTGKSDDNGPTFKVINKTDKVVLHGKVVVYYYDKAGKQLEILSAAGSANTKPKLFHSCSGSIFGGIMKPGEKAFLTFSCVKKDRVPEGTKAIEAEIQTVGFSDETEKKVSHYWRNPDLSPDERPKGGPKSKKK